MKSITLTAGLLLAVPLVLRAQQPTAARPAAQGAMPAVPPGFEVPKEMTTYYLALYVRGPKFMEGETPEHTVLTKRHLSYIRRMIEQKKYMVAGPLLDGGDKQGLAIIAAANADEAKRIAEGDPAIAAGHMAVEMHPAMLPSLASLVIRY